MSYQADIERLAWHRHFAVPAPEAFDACSISKKYGKTLGQVREDINAAIDRLPLHLDAEAAMDNCEGT